MLLASTECGNIFPISSCTVGPDGSAKFKPVNPSPATDINYYVIHNGPIRISADFGRERDRNLDRIFSQE